MKANELMVDDYIMFNKNIYIIEEISKKGWVRLIYNDGSECRVELSNDYILGDITPIPLTAEILEKNGFVKMSNSPSPYVMLYMWSTGGVAEFADVTIQVGQDHAYKWRWDYLTLKIHLFKGDITLHKIHYIHELQHALRLCNIEKEIIV